MKPLRFLVLIFASVAIGTAVPPMKETEKEEKVLNIFTWPDYIGPNTIEDFEREYGIKVNYDTYDSTEMAEARLLAGRTGYDVVDHAERYSARLIPIGVYQPLDRARAHQLEESRPGNSREAADCRSGQPLWRALHVGHHRLHVQRAHDPRAHARCPGEQRRHDLQARDRAPLRGLRHQLPRRAHGRDPDGDAVPGPRSEQRRREGSRRCRKALEERAPLHPLFQLREDADRPAERGSVHRHELVGGLRAGHVSRRGGRPAGRSSRTRFRSEGTLAWFDLWFIPADAPHPGNALLFLNYMMRPQVIADCSNEIRYAAPNVPAMALLDPEVRDDPAIYPPEDIRRGMHVAALHDPKLERLRSRLWSRVKTGL